MTKHITTAYEMTETDWRRLDTFAWEHLGRWDFGWFDEDGNGVAPYFHSDLNSCRHILADMEHMVTPKEYRGPKVRISSNKWGWSCSTFYGKAHAPSLEQAILVAYKMYRGTL